MTKFSAIASHLDRLGFRKLIALMSGLIYKDRKFSVDKQGRWLNIQTDCVIVSRTINTMNLSSIGIIAEKNWFYRYALKEGDTIIDVGAGIGDEVVYFSKIVGRSGRVIAIEASPKTFSCLQETIKLSKLDNVTCLNIAISDTNGFVMIEDGEEHLSNSIGRNGSVKVDSLTLDTLIARLDLKNIDLLKMNIEGAESMAIAGLSNARKNIKNAAISCHDFLAADGSVSFFRTKSVVISRLKEIGFKVNIRKAVKGEPWVGDYIYASR